MTIAGKDRADPEVRDVRGDRPLQVVSHNHTSITFRVPPGESARNNLTVSVFGQVSNGANFTYNPPVITELQDISGAPLVFGGCCRWDFVIFLCVGCLHAVSLLFYLHALPLRFVVQHQGRFPDPCAGHQLGIPRREPPHLGGHPPVPQLDVVGERYGSSAVRRSQGLPLRLAGTVQLMHRVCICPTKRWNFTNNLLEWFLSSQDCFEESARLPVDNYVQHNIITCTVPSGVGANLSIGIFVGRDEVRMSNLTLFSYDPPRIDFVQPDPVDAKGQEMTIYGANFADANGVRRCVCCGSL